MSKLNRQIAREFGSALGVLALLVLTLLAPVHAVAEARASLGDHDAIIFCLGDPHDPDAKPHLGLACDLCAVAHVAKAFAAPSPAVAKIPLNVAYFVAVPVLPQAAPDETIAQLPQARGPPNA